MSWIGSYVTCLCVVLYVLDWELRYLFVCCVICLGLGVTLLVCVLCYMSWIGSYVTCLCVVLYVLDWGLRNLILFRVTYFGMGGTLLDVVLCYKKNVHVLDWKVHYSMLCCAACYGLRATLLQFLLLCDFIGWGVTISNVNIFRNESYVDQTQYSGYAMKSLKMPNW